MIHLGLSRKFGPHLYGFIGGNGDLGSLNLLGKLSILRASKPSPDANCLIYLILIPFSEFTL